MRKKYLEWNKTPAWEHDCENCKFLETVTINQGEKYAGLYDIYICGKSSIIARASDEPSDNYSWDLESLNRLPNQHPLRTSHKLCNKFLDKLGRDKSYV
jgi:hypothetical protein